MKGMGNMAFAQLKTYTEKDYYSLPEDVRAELIDGQIYYMAVPGRIHQEILMFLSKTIANYIDQKGGPCRIYPGPFAVKLFQNHTTIVEPDISVICNPDKLTSRGCTGAPDWIIEIVSPSSKPRDYLTKLFQYRTAEVREYWIVDPDKGMTTVYSFEKDTVEQYAFGEDIPVGIYDGFSICIR